MTAADRARPGNDPDLRCECDTATGYQCAGCVADGSLSAMTAPAPADGAPGERVSAHPLARCPRCGQCDTGQTGEYPCSECGLPTVWDDDEILGSEDERKAVADALDYAANDYALVPSGDVRQTIIRAAALLRATAAPLPAPSASAGVGAREWRERVRTSLVELRPSPPCENCWGDPCGECSFCRVWAGIDDACDALSTAAAPVRPDRAAVEAAVIDYGDAERLDALRAMNAAALGSHPLADLSAARARLLALVFGDSAPGEVDRGE